MPTTQVFIMEIKIKIPLVGPTHCLSPSDVLEWHEVIAFLQTKEEACDFSFYYDGEEYTGKINYDKTLDKVILSFGNDKVVLPSMMCLTTTCVPCVVTREPCPHDETVLDDDTKIAILDEQGCPTQFVLFSALKENILKDVKIKFCDLFPDGQITQGSLVAGDRLLTTNPTLDGCGVKSVPVTDIVCD